MQGVFSKIKTMNLKRIFGPLLTLLGIAGIIYASYLFIGNKGEWLNALILFIVAGVFFSSGIGLIKGTEDRSHV